VGRVIELDEAKHVEVGVTKAVVDAIGLDGIPVTEKLFSLFRVPGVVPGDRLHNASHADLRKQLVLGERLFEDRKKLDFVVGHQGSGLVPPSRAARPANRKKEPQQQKGCKQYQYSGHVSTQKQKARVGMLLSPADGK
jgi:hypothetical protein